MLEMQRECLVLNEKFAQRGWPQLKIGVGVNSGVMRVGNMGSQIRRAYTVMGDPVNLGSRLEGITKEYGADIIVGEGTKDAVPEVVFRELDRVRVKGKDGQSRAIYVTARGKRVVLVRVFVKKTEKTPRREIDLALERAKGVHQ
jgi:class 3 adenylate cyclase